MEQSLMRLRVARRRRTRVTVAPRHPSPVRHRPAGRPRQVVFDPGPVSSLDSACVFWRTSPPAAAYPALRSPKSS